MCESKTKYINYDIDPKNTEKRERVILYQLIPDIIVDIGELCGTSPNKKTAHHNIDYKLDELFKLREKAYDLLDKQDKYTIEDVYDKFQETYITTRELIKKLSG